VVYLLGVIGPGAATWIVSTTSSERAPQVCTERQSVHVHCLFLSNALDLCEAFSSAHGSERESGSLTKPPPHRTHFRTVPRRSRPGGPRSLFLGLAGTGLRRSMNNTVHICCVGEASNLRNELSLQKEASISTSASALVAGLVVFEVHPMQARAALQSWRKCTGALVPDAFSSEME